MPTWDCRRSASTSCATQAAAHDPGGSATGRSWLLTLSWQYVAGCGMEEPRRLCGPRARARPLSTEAWTSYARRCASRGLSDSRRDPPWHGATTPWPRRVGIRLLVGGPFRIHFCEVKGPRTGSLTISGSGSKRVWNSSTRRTSRFATAPSWTRSARPRCTSAHVVVCGCLVTWPRPKSFRQNSPRPLPSPGTSDPLQKREVHCVGRRP